MGTSKKNADNESGKLRGAATRTAPQSFLDTAKVAFTTDYSPQGAHRSVTN